MSQIHSVLINLSQKGHNTSFLTLPERKLIVTLLQVTESEVTQQHRSLVLLKLSEITQSTCYSSFIISNLAQVNCSYFVDSHLLTRDNLHVWFIVCVFHSCVSETESMNERFNK